LEPLESLLLLSFADGNGPVVTALTALPGSNQLVITFDGPLNPGPAQVASNYQVTKALANPKLVSRSGAPLRVISAAYTDTSASQVTLTLMNSLKPGVFYRVIINGTPASMSVNAASNPLTDINGVLFDGDNDDTPGGDFYGLFETGAKVSFTDSYNARVSMAVKGGGKINIWRELDGDVDQLSVVGPGAAASTLTGSVRRARGRSQTVYIGSVTIPVATPLSLNDATDLLPSPFVVVTKPATTAPPPPTAVSATPVLATSQNLPYSLSITPVNTSATPLLPGIQAADYAFAAPTAAYPKGLCLVTGGRTNGLHNFTTSGVTNFPADFQNEDIIVINPANWQTWSLPWSQTDVPAATYNSLSSSAQEFYQKGGILYAVGGYSVPDSINFAGNTTAGSTTVDVSDLGGLAVGQFVSGPGIPLFLPNSQTQADVTITAVGTSTITISQAATATASGAALNAATSNYTTYDTLTSININGMIAAVIHGGDLARAAAIRQVSDPRLAVTGGNISTVGDRTFLVFGQNFQGGYNIPAPPTAQPSFTQIYIDEIQSFKIVKRGRTLGIAGYQALRDPTNFRRRDGNLGEVVEPNGRQNLTYYGGVFSPGAAGTAYQSPISIAAGGKTYVDSRYQQFFDQYSTASIALFDQKKRAMDTVFFGGISLYDYVNGQPTEFTPAQGGPGWVDDVSTLMQRPNGLDQEFVMQPLPGLYGAYGAFMNNPRLPLYANGVIKLNKLKPTTILGYIYGGIYSTVAETSGNPAIQATQTGGSNQVFQVTLTRTRP
jgi:hypothetical protein